MLSSSDIYLHGRHQGIGSVGGVSRRNSNLADRWCALVGLFSEDMGSLSRLIQTEEYTRLLWTVNRTAGTIQISIQTFR